MPRLFCILIVRSGTYAAIKHAETGRVLHEERGAGAEDRVRAYSKVHKVRLVRS